MIVWRRVTVPTYRLTLCVLLLIRRLFIAHRIISSAQQGTRSTRYINWTSSISLKPLYKKYKFVKFNTQHSQESEEITGRNKNSCKQNSKYEKCSQLHTKGSSFLLFFLKIKQIILNFDNINLGFHSVCKQAMLLFDKLAILVGALTGTTK
jgi:hypothetical protein